MEPIAPRACEQISSTMVWVPSCVQIGPVRSKTLLQVLRKARSCLRACVARRLPAVLYHLTERSAHMALDKTRIETSSRLNKAGLRYHTFQATSRKAWKWLRCNVEGLFRESWSRATLSKRTVMCFDLLGSKPTLGTDGIQMFGNFMVSNLEATTKSKQEKRHDCSCDGRVTESSCFRVCLKRPELRASCLSRLILPELK